MRTARIAVPTIATAALATSVGFLVLLLSPVPMVRGFGVLLVVGIAIAFFLALSAGTAALAATARRRGGGGQLGASARGAAELVDELGARVWRLLAPVRRLGGRAREATLRGAFERPKRVLLIGLVLALAGLALDSQTKVNSDLRELVPQDLRSVRDLDTLQKATGVAGEIDVVVQSKDLTDPKVVAWMRALPVRDPQALPLLGQERLREGRHLPGAVAHRPVPDGQRGQDAGGHPRAAGRGAALLLAGGDHRRPQDGDARVRDPADAARRAAEGDRRDA